MTIQEFMKNILNNINGYVYIDRIHDINMVTEWYTFDGNLVLSIHDGSFESNTKPYTNKEMLFIANLFDKNKKVLIDCNNLHSVLNYYIVEGNILLKL